MCCTESGMSKVEAQEARSTSKTEGEGGGEGELIFGCGWEEVRGGRVMTSEGVCGRRVWSKGVIRWRERSDGERRGERGEGRGGGGPLMVLSAEQDMSTLEAVGCQLSRVTFFWWPSSVTSLAVAMLQFV